MKAGRPVKEVESMSTRTSTKPLEARPATQPARKLAPVVVVHPKPVIRAASAGHDWLIAIMLACVCAFVVAFATYVMRPPSDTVAATSNETASGEQP
jgi:hypothetical protein